MSWLQHRIDFLQLMMNAHKERQLAAEQGDMAAYKTADSTWTEKGLSQCTCDLYRYPNIILAHSGINAMTYTSVYSGLTREEIEAQAILFFLAGYDTTASTIAFFLYCMAMNPDCQERLYNEVTTAFGDKVK